MELQAVAPSGQLHFEAKKSKQVVDPASAVKGSDHNRCQWDVHVRQSYKAMNPMSREIADTNFLETKIHSSKYIMAKT